ncbi:hypothetical protein BC831DRAFT_482308 [Entophlyctis helioformis]|nr:hypothetical protein BC831DRAFT_482308 [Entophlyctis helioformis]
MNTGDRIKDLRTIISKTADVAGLFDKDGIQVRFMNSSAKGDGIRSADQVNDLIGKVPFNGGTPLGTEFKAKIVKPLVLKWTALAKPVLAIIITDGEPTTEPHDKFASVVRDTMASLAKSKYGTGALAIQIGQVGDDENAQRFLAALDKDESFGDMLDCTSNYEMESAEFAAKGARLTPELWLLKLCLGAIDDSYDDADT